MAIAAFIGFIVFVSLADLDHVPPLGWDEGWTMAAARSWVERGYVGLSAAVPTVASVALSFRLLGVGVWQGRLAIAVYGFVALARLYALHY